MRNYRSILILFICTSFLSFSFAETALPATTFSSALKVYVDSSSKKIFWPMDLPFWVKLATSSDKNAPSFLIDQYSEEAGSSIDKKLDNGIKIGLSGKQILRWINHSNEKETYLKFYADGTPPVVTDSFYGAPVFMTKSNIFYGYGLKYAVFAKDALSGVDSIVTSLDKGPFIPYEQPFELNMEKEYKISSYAVDKVGYASTLKTERCIVDLSPPVSGYQAQNNFFDNILSNSTTIRLSSIDKLSGVKAMFYKFDNQPNFFPYTGQPFYLNNFADGEHVLSFYGIDNVSNKENPVDFSFYLDKVPPVPQIAITGDTYVTGKNAFISPRSLVELTAVDNKIGVGQIQYTINYNKKFENYENPFSINLPNGPLSIGFLAIDKLGNVSQKFDKVYVVDNTPPKSEYKITGPNYQQRAAMWVTNATTLEFFSSDRGSGVQRIEYQIGTEKAEKFDKPVSINQEGKYTVRYWGVDNVNNVENGNVLLVIVDNSNPEIKQIFSVAPIDSAVNGEGKLVNVYPQHTSVFLAATDQAAGIKNVWYSLNGAVEQEYHNVILCDKTGDYTIKIRAEDNVGHFAGENLSFSIKAIEGSK